MCPKALARQMNCDERRRTSGIDDQARSAQVEHVRQTVRNDAVRRSRSGVRIDVAQIRGLAQVVVGACAMDADEYTARSTGEAFRRNSGILQRFPGRL